MSRFLRKALFRAVIVFTISIISTVSPFFTRISSTEAATTVNVSTLLQLQSAVSNLQSNTTIIMAAGTYNLSGPLYIPQGTTNIVIKGATGNRDDVIVQGSGMSGGAAFGFWVGNTQNITFQDFTIRNIWQHGIILNAGAESPVFRNLRITDTGDQQIKANPDGSGGGVDNGIVEDSIIEYSTLAPDNYTNGVDVHTGANWIIRRNIFRNFRSSDGILTGPAILIWNSSRNTLTERNIFINNARDIHYGLDANRSNDHSGGIIRNNMIYRVSGTGGDVAIGLFNSPNTKVLNNTIKINGSYPNAIEYRFSSTSGVEIRNNLVDAAIVSREGGSATVANNVTNAASTLFVNAGSGDLHLVSGASTVIDKATTHPDVTIDFDGQARPVGLAPDLGADEFTSSGTPTSTPSPSSGPAVCDLNKDNQTNILDLQYLANIILGISSNPGTADLNKDGQTNILDLQYLANVILGKSGCL